MGGVKYEVSKSRWSPASPIECIVAKVRLESGVEHILRCEGQLHIPLPGISELLKQRHEVFPGVGVVFHHMGSEPHLSEAELLIGLQHLQGVVERFDAVVDSWKDMGMPVGESLEDARCLQTFYGFKRPHLPFSFLLMITHRLSGSLHTLVVAIYMVAAMGGVGAIEDHAHVLVALLVVEHCQLVESRALKQPCTHHEERAVDHGVDHLGVDHDVDRRTVNEYIVVLLLSLGQQLGQTPVVEKLGGVGGQGAGREDVEVGIIG